VRFFLNGELKSTTIGAFNESDPSNGLIAYDSPLARILIGLHEEQEAENQLAGRLVEIKIVSIKPPSAEYNNLIENLYAGGNEIEREPAS
jgi:hypothetical protein